jgi:hypothetical protein
VTVATFDSEMRRRVLLAGLSIRALAAAVHVDPSYLAKISRGERQPSCKLADAIDRHLGAAGELAALAEAEQDAAQRPCTRPLDDSDTERFRATIDRLVELDTAHGSDGLHIVAARAFDQAQKDLATAGAESTALKDLQVTVAELGEVAAWLAYDAEHQDLSRRLATDSLLLTRVSGDTAMERFVLSHLAMQAVYTGRPAEALAISDRVLAEHPRSRRVGAMFRLRRARALGGLGAGQEALDTLHRARSDLMDGTGNNDPDWTWWLHEAELSVHEARLRAAVGDRRGAVEWSQRAVTALPGRQGRDGALYRAWLLRDLVDVHSWRDAARVAGEILARDKGGTARVPRIVRRALVEIEKPGSRAPASLRDMVRRLAA